MARRWRSAGPLILVSLILLVLPATAFAQDTRPRFVIAVLGDSYASGEGSPDVHGRHSLGGDLVAAECIQLPFTPPPCFTETWWSPDSWFSGRDAVFPQQDDSGWQDAARRCHRSSKAPGPHAAMLIADRFPDVRVEVLDFACGGSTIGPACSQAVNPVDATCAVAQPGAGGLLLGWPGPEPPPFAPNLPPQVTALRDYANSTGRGGDIDAIVVNIGGNDAEFDDIVTDCLAILNALDADCTDNASVRRVRERLTPDAASPPFGNVEAPLSERYRAMDQAIRANGGGRPDEVYLTALPNPARDAPPVDNPQSNPQDFCDGTQTADDLYNNASRAESQLIEGTLDGLNDAMQRAADRHSWVFMPQMFDAWRDHGICADAASFLRTNTAALRIQGGEGIPLPNISPGVAHPNEAGYANRASIVADVVEEHVRMRFRAPVLTLGGIRANSGFDISWSDPSPSHLRETFWEGELASPGSIQTIRSSGAGETDGFQELAGNGRFWAVPRRGEFQVRVRGCRSTPTGSYCGPFSNAVTVSTERPGTPLDLRRTAAQPIDSTVDFPVRLAWSPGPNTPASARYELIYGRFGGSGCSTRTIGSCTLLTDTGQLSTTSTATRIVMPRPGEWWFQVRGCAAAGCSPYSGTLITQVSDRPLLPTSPIGTFTVRAPQRARAGRRARVDVAWRTPGRWTRLDRIDVPVRAGRRRLGTIRLSQDDGVFWLLKGKRRRFGHPDTRGRLKLGALAIDLARSSIVRFGPRSRRVVLRLAIVPGRQLRGRRLVLGMSARNDRGRGQAARLAGVIRVR